MIEFLSEERAKRVGAIIEGHGVTGNDVIRELAAIGFSKITDIVEWRSNIVAMREDPNTGEERPTIANEVVLKDFDKLSDRTKAAIAEVSQNSDGALKVKMHPKQPALRALGQHLGLWNHSKPQKPDGTEKVGKKRQAELDAETAGQGGDWGGLLN